MATPSARTTSASSRVDETSLATNAKPSVAATTFALLPIFPTGRAARLTLGPILTRKGTAEDTPTKFLANFFDASLIDQVGAPGGRTTPRANGNGPRKAVAHESYSHTKCADYDVTSAPIELTFRRLGLDVLQRDVDHYVIGQCLKCAP